jgi:hypothetical protein
MFREDLKDPAKKISMMSWLRYEERRLGRFLEGTLEVRPQPLDPQFISLQNIPTNSNSSV